MRAQSLLLLASVSCGGQFEVGHGDAPSEVVGRVVLGDGQPLQGALVSVHNAPEPFMQSRTGADGRFELRLNAQGRFQIVVHAGDGRGTVLNVSLTRGARHDAGDMALESLLLWPKVLELRGLGYEEKISSFPATSSYHRAIRIDADQYWFFTPTETAGAKTIAVTHVGLGDSPRAVAGPVLDSADAIFDIDLAWHDDVEPLALVTTIGSELWLVGAERTARLDNKSSFGPSAVYNDGAHIWLVWGPPLHGTSGVFIDQIETNGALVDSRYVEEFTEVVSSWPLEQDRRRDRRVIVVGPHEGTSWWWVMDLADGSVSPLTAKTSDIDVFSAPDDATVIVLTSTATEGSRRIVRLDDAGSRDLALLPATSQHFVNPSLHGTDLYLPMDDGRGFAIVDIQSGAVSRLDRTDIDDFDFQRSCMGTDVFRPQCTVEFATEERVRYRIWPCEPELQRECAVDVLEDAEPRRFDIGPQNRSNSLYASPLRRWDIWNRQVFGSGSQAFVAPLGAPVQDFRQVTYFPRARSILGFDADEQWLYYLMADPFDDDEALFRVRLEAP